MLVRKTPGVGSSEAPRDDAGTGAGKLTADEKHARRLKLWAFGVSPHGLGLTSEAFWCLTYAEYHALREVQEAPIKRWALEMADARNSRLGTNDEPWTVEDLLGRGDREKRMLKRKSETVGEKLAIKKVERKLLMMRPGERPAGLPDFWPGPKKKKA